MPFLFAAGSEEPCPPLFVPRADSGREAVDHEVDGHDQMAEGSFRAAEWGLQGLFST